MVGDEGQKVIVPLMRQGEGGEDLPRNRGTDAKRRSLSIQYIETRLSARRRSLSYLLPY
jgi:hypothetical protein